MYKKKTETIVTLTNQSIRLMALGTRVAMTADFVSK